MGRRIGKRVKVTKTFKKKKDAQLALKKFEADKIKGILVFPSTLTVKDWLEYWLNDINSIVKGTKNRSSNRTLYIPREIVELLKNIKNKQNEQKKL